MDILSKQAVGQLSEKKAHEFLQAKGLTLLQSNFRCKSGEIDLIMRDKNTVVFVEVRTKNNKSFGSPIETVDRRKQKKIIKTAIHYLRLKNWFDKVNCRFDIVAITQNNLEWIPNAFTDEA